MKFNLVIATLCAVLTLSACGESEVQEKTQQTETIAQQDTTSIEPEEVSEEETPKEEAIKRYSLGDTLTVSEDGVDLYEITFDKAFLTEDRNQFSEKEAEKVVVIEYTYENIADEENLYVFDSNFKVYDASGNVLETYPAGAEKYPQAISKGKKCTANMSFALNNESNNLELEFYDNMFDGKASEVFNVIAE